MIIHQYIIHLPGVSATISISLIFFIDSAAARAAASACSLAFFAASSFAWKCLTVLETNSYTKTMYAHPSKALIIYYGVLFFIPVKIRQLAPAGGWTVAKNTIAEIPRAGVKALITFFGIKS